MNQLSLYPIQSTYYLTTSLPYEVCQFIIIYLNKKLLMKAIKILFLFCIATLSLSNVHGQKPCEIDSYTNNYETGFKIIQSSIDKSIYTISISGLNGRLGNDKPNFNLTKYNSCGDLQWKSNLWSSSLPGFGVGGIWEETNGDIISSIFYKNNLG